MGSKIMTIAVYARKSVYRDNSDSTKAQLEMCSTRCRQIYPGCSTIEYEDEGFTGANTNRPGFKRMMSDIKKGKIDLVFCYKLDRVSRNIVDFVNFYGQLQEYNVEFGCLRDNIDTTTPIGRTMMYIVSAFAEMERENIKERVTDGMIDLAKGGFWTGGKPPIGYNTRQVVVDGKKHHILIPNPVTRHHLELKQDMYLAGKSANVIQKELSRSGILQENGSFYTAVNIQRELRSPFCCTADQRSYLYFKKLGCQMVDNGLSWDGTHGIMVYGRRKGYKVNPHSSWRVCPGRHDPICSSEKWISIQERAGTNAIDKTRKYDCGLLRGILRCKCGHIMTVDNKKRPSGRIDTYYKCSYRTKFSKSACDMEAIKVDVLDEAAIEKLKEICLDRSLISQYSDNVLRPVRRSEKDILKDIRSREKKIANLTAAIASGSSSAKYIIGQIEKLDKEILPLQDELNTVLYEKELEKERENDANSKFEQVQYFINSMSKMDYNTVNQFLRKILKSCTWDGSELNISL